MPIVSKAQQRWAYANKDKKTAEGRAAADFVAAGPKGGSFKKLPASKGGYAKKADDAPKHAIMIIRFGHL